MNPTQHHNQFRDEIVVLLGGRGLAEFLSQGGRLEDVRMDDMRPFLSAVENERVRFQFPAMGIGMLGVERLAAAIHGFGEGGRFPSFSEIVVE